MKQRSAFEEKDHACLRDDGMSVNAVALVDPHRAIA